MKILAAAFTTALAVFAFASVLSETLSKNEAVVNNESEVRRIPSRAKSDGSASRTARTVVRTTPRDAPDVHEVNDDQNDQLQRSLHAVRQRERALETRQAALDLAFEEIRNEQASVERLRQQVTTEIAALRNASRRVAERDTLNSEARPILTSSSRSTQDRASAQLQLNDAQSIQDAAHLIGRLAKDGSLQSAVLLLRKMKERDAAKVLAALDKTDSRTASDLGEELLASRSNTTIRR